MRIMPVCFRASQLQIVHTGTEQAVSRLRLHLTLQRPPLVRVGLTVGCLHLQVLSLKARTYQLQDTGLEIFFAGRASLYLTLRTQEERDTFARALQAQPALRLRLERTPEQWRRDWCKGKVWPSECESEGCMSCNELCRTGGAAELDDPGNNGTKPGPSGTGGLSLHTERRAAGVDAWDC